MAFIEKLRLWHSSVHLNLLMAGSKFKHLLKYLFFYSKSIWLKGWVGWGYYNRDFRKKSYKRKRLKWIPELWHFHASVRFLRKLKQQLKQTYLLCPGLRNLHQKNLLQFVFRSAQESIQSAAVKLFTLLRHAVRSH